ncbi:MAG TPA: hypothetical protein VMT46_12225 [Anaerolineaceae bacterium]|nr:hypothetical protein [Anaerolineaceae bacterium]
MSAVPRSNQAPQPQFIAALRGGFDAIASNIALILFPVVLDLFLWLGPHFQIKPIVTRALNELASNPMFKSPQMDDILKAGGPYWMNWAEHFNIASALRTFPVGISSLMSSTQPIDSPFGEPAMISIGSGSVALGLWVLFTVIGLFLGSLYFGAVAKVIPGQNIPYNLGQEIGDVVQVYLLAFSLVVLLAVILIPSFILLSFLALISTTIAQIAFLFLTLLLVWILVPLIFSPHGIFIYHQNAWRSMLTSVRLVRFIVPGTGLFILSVIVLSQGLNLLWQTPPASSWLGLVGVAGHAFVTTALLAASYVYYRDANRWVQEFLQSKLGAQPQVPQAP